MNARMNRFVSSRQFGCFVVVLALGAPVWAGSHSWRFSEVFSNASGTVQFIELRCDASPTEIFLGSLQVTTANGTFTFPGNLVGPTTNKKLLLATNAFTLLPGAPARDYAIPDGFIPINGGTIRYNPPSNYDTWVYGAGVIPTDGVNSVQFTSFLPGSGVDTFTTGTNDPTNYSGGSGTVNAACLDIDLDGYGNPGDASCPNGAATDCNDNNAAIHPGATELCSDGADNNCNSLTDCTDPACALAVPECVPTVSEWGVAVMSLLMLNLGSVLIRRRL